MRLALPLLALALLAGSPRSAAQYRVSAFVDASEAITLDDTIRLTLQVEGDGPLGSIKPPRLPQLVNLRLVGGPNQHINTSWVNGQTRSTLQLRYALSAIRAGTAEVPAIELEAGSQIYRTEPIRFEVLAAGAGAGAAPAPGRPSRDPRAASAPRGADLFIEAVVPKTEMWVGESLPLSVTLFTSEMIYSGGWREQPSLTGFWVEELEFDQRAETQRILREGRAFEVKPLRRVVLVPQSPGTYEIEPFVLEAQVRKRSSDPFDSFFSLGRMESVLRRTPPITLEVRALPEQGKPASFSGAVGRFKLEAKMDRAAAQVNDAVAVTATIEGEGFLGSVKAPQLAAPAGVRVLDPEVRVSQSSRRGTFTSRKTWEWILVPTSPGELELPALAFSYFDPAAATYRTVESPLGTLAVERGAASGEEPTVARGEVELARRELQFIKPRRGELRLETLRAHERPAFVILLAAPLVWIPAAVWLGRRHWHLQSNRTFARARRAGTRARKRLRHAERHMAGADGAIDFHQEVARALVGYVADRFDRAAAGLTYEMADELLASRGLDQELRRRFRSCLETCDFARFVPASAESGRKAEVLREASELVQSLERAS